MKFLLIVILSFAVPSSWCLPAAGDLRLMPGSPTCGRLEIFWNNTWGTVNASGFCQTNRDVACRQLGFPNAKGCPVDPRSWLQGMGMGMGMGMNGSSGFNNPMTNDSDRMREALWNMTHCDAMPPLSIRCFGNSTMPPMEPTQNSADGTIRLAGGNMINEGQLELFWNGTWISFCFEAKLMNYMLPNFTNSVCRHMGYCEGGEPLDNSAMSEPQWQIGVQCLGNETALRDCPRMTPQSAYYNHDVWMSCVSAENVCPSMPSPPTSPPTPSPPPTPVRTTVRPLIQSTKANFVPGKACNDAKTFKKHQTACLKWLCKKVTYRKQNKKQCKDF